VVSEFLEAAALGASRVRECEALLVLARARRDAAMRLAAQREGVTERELALATRLSRAAVHKVCGG
jgi:hypothetical protein